MRLLRGLLGALLWIVAAVLGLLGVVLCVTVILLPLGIPLLVLARRLLTRAVQLMLPRSLAHPVNEVTKTAKKKGRKAKTVTSGAADDIEKKVRKLRKRVA
jgi:Flp pilus assembly protein TadB